MQRPRLITGAFLCLAIVGSHTNVGKMSAIQAFKLCQSRNPGTNLLRIQSVVPRDRLELSTPAFSVPCSTT